MYLIFNFSFHSALATNATDATNATNALLLVTALHTLFTPSVQMEAF